MDVHPQLSTLASQATKHSIHGRNRYVSDASPCSSMNHHASPVSCDRSGIHELSTEQTFNLNNSRPLQLPSTPPKDGSLNSKSYINMPLTPPQTPPQTPPHAKSPTATSQIPCLEHCVTTKYPKFFHPICPDLFRRKRQRSVWHLVREPGGECITVPLEGGIVQGKDFRKPLSRLQATAHPEYEIHVGNPCGLDCLDHILGCSHRIITLRPEACGANCHVRQQPDYSQPRDIDSSFICMQCITDHLMARHAQRYVQYKAELEDMAAELGMGPDWIELKLSYIDIAWRDQDIEEMRQLCETGKPSYPFHLNAISAKYQSLVLDALDKRRTAALHQSKRASISSAKSSTASMSRSLTESHIASQEPNEHASPSKITRASTLFRGDSGRPQQWRQSMQQLFNTKSAPTAREDEKSDAHSVASNRTRWSRTGSARSSQPSLPPISHLEVEDADVWCTHIHEE